MKGDSHVHPFSLAAGVILGTALISTAATAQQSCNDRDKALALLTNKYQEAPVGIGVSNTGKLVELLTTADGRTWTIIETTPDGRTCLVASGEGWRKVEHEGPEA